MLRSLLMSLDDVARAERPPRSLALHYLRAPAEGPVEVRTVIEHSGRTLSTLTARMIQEGKTTTMAVGTFGKPVLDYEFQDVEPPEVGPPESHAFRQSEKLVPMGQRVENRLAIGGSPWQGIDRAITGGWMRLKGEREPDALMLAMLADAWYPSIFARETGGAFMGAVPTIDLAIHFRAAFPLSGLGPGDYYLGRFESTTTRQGYIVENGEIWSQDGVLLQQSRQLARKARPYGWMTGRSARSSAPEPPCGRPRVDRGRRRRRGAGPFPPRCRTASRFPAGGAGSAPSPRRIAPRTGRR
jgi:acyl-CoA thioesterase